MLCRLSAHREAAKKHGETFLDFVPGDARKGARPRTTGLCEARREQTPQRPYAPRIDHENHPRFFWFAFSSAISASIAWIRVCCFLNVSPITSKAA